MAMTRRSLGGAGALILVAGAVLFYLSTGSDDSPGETGETGENTSAVEADTAGQRRLSSDSPPPPTPVALTAVIDPDPEGTLRLEGQVLGPDDSPVAGAIVNLSSNPPQIAVSEDDGSFSSTTWSAKPTACRLALTRWWEARSFID